MQTGPLNVYFYLYYRLPSTGCLFSVSAIPRETLIFSGKKNTESVPQTPSVPKQMSVPPLL